MNACAFDLDGTLVNSLSDLADSANFALTQQGFSPHPVDEYRYYVGRGIPKLIESILPAEARAPELEARTKALFEEYYGLHSLDKTLPYEGIPEMISALKGQGRKIAVVSNKSDPFARRIVSAFFGDAFDAVVGGRASLPKKPDPAAVFDACRALDVRPEQCAFVGDSGIDMQTALNAGMYPIGALWGFRSREELLENGARRLIERPSELPELLEGVTL